ncbi:MAG: prepilin-type N-terminal cleavage/methylation domain-containing protein [Actinobacteria bacterium]|nr:prepilin-type N-terminal cleavage/methylation domain-containing protein [Actinomycetota bacterium]
MAILRRPKPDLRCQSGYSLIELITVMAILGLVLAGLTTMFQAGVRAEVRSNREFQAQQNARLAMDRIRRELHCANAISAPNGTAVATVSVTLPAACPGTAATVTYATVAVSAGRWQLTRAADSGAAVAVADYLTVDTPFTYYIPAAGTLGRLRVDLPVNLNPTDASTEWRLQDDIVLRNTVRL